MKMILPNSGPRITVAMVLVAVVAVIAAACGSSAGQKAAAPSIVAAPVQVAHTSDGTVSYRSIGSGSPLVLIMGFPYGMDEWPPSFVDALAKAHRVVTFDNAGIGKTSPLHQQVSISAMADQTDALIHALRLGRTGVLGWSMGGFIAQALAVEHPADIARLILCATAPGNGKATPPTAAADQALSRPNQTLGMENLLFPTDQQTKEVSAYAAQIAKYPNPYGASVPAERQQSIASVAWLAGKDPAGSSVSDIKAATLIGGGDDDEALPPANDERLHQDIPQSHLVLYPGAGHGFWFQDSGAWVAEIESFLD
jgi:pimeloyl-ACP methyl ester carboxylesterase